MMLRSTGKKPKGKIIKKILCIVPGIIVLISTTAVALLRNEIATVASIKKISDRPVYEIEYHGEYSFDKYLKTGVKSELEMEQFLKKNLAHGLAAIGGSGTKKRGCSAFLAKTPKGDVIMARDLDTPAAMPAVVKTSPKGGYKAVGMANLYQCIGYPKVGKKELDFKSKPYTLASPYFTFDGMNEKGLAAAVFTLAGSKASADAGKATLYDTTVIRMMLDKAKNVEEGIRLLQQYNVVFGTYPSQYMIADAAGNSAVIEFVDGRMQVINKQGDYQIVSNFQLYNNESLSGFGADRYKAYDDVLSKTKGVINTEDALKLLEKNTIHGDAQWSAVYNLTQRTISLAIYNDYDTVFRYQVK
ncbi:MAG: linear amide C-N hydrolase [Bacillota bacterium]|nr:linear amide C-N hydrolase [Bacillota bacterium]